MLQQHLESCLERVLPAVPPHLREGIASQALRLPTAFFDRRHLWDVSRVQG